VIRVMCHQNRNQEINKAINNVHISAVLVFCFPRYLDSDKFSDD
jgi:hypothetical protein